MPTPTFDLFVDDGDTPRPRSTWQDVAGGWHMTITLAEGVTLFGSPRGLRTFVNGLTDLVDEAIEAECQAEVAAAGLADCRRALASGIAAANVVSLS